jgi:hypothetical protein
MNDIPAGHTSSAKDIYYVMHASGMQEYELFCRFTVDADALDKTVEDLVGDFNQRMGGRVSFVRLPISSAPESPDHTQWSPLPWWSPKAITNGYYRGSVSNRPFHVWADVANHVIYLSETD